MKLKQKPDGSCKKEYVVCVLFGVYVAAVLWITLFSRIGTYERQFLLPFQSIIKAFSGRWTALIQDIENIILFLPMGFFAGSIGIKRVGKVIIIGFCASLFIECSQYIFWLGVFEFDDLINNTLGTFIGYLIVTRIQFFFQFKLNSKRMKAILIALVLTGGIPFICLALRHQKMITYAAKLDKKDGTRNLMVLKGDSGRVESDIYIEYTDEGGICLSGNFKNGAWRVISDIELHPGKYIVENLSDNSDGYVGIWLAEYRNDSKKYKFFTSGIEETYEFELQETKKIRVYLRINPIENDSSCVLMPVIYESK